MSDTDYTTLQKFSEQPTTIAETTMAETIGLSMHNLVANQQQSQVTTSASVTNACARLLAIPQASPTKPEPKPEAPKKKSIFSRS